jgi:hypothetical protein
MLLQNMTAKTVEFIETFQQVARWQVRQNIDFVQSPKCIHRASSKMPIADVTIVGKTWHKYRSLPGADVFSTYAFRRFDTRGTKNAFFVRYADFID